MIDLIKKAWLEWAEYLSIFFTVIGLIVAVVIDWSTPFFLAVTLALVFNLINRLRSENRTKSRMGAALGIQLRRFSEEVDEIKAKVDLYLSNQKKIVLPPKLVSNMAKSEDQVIASLQEDLESIHKSLVSTIDYLKEKKLEVRLKNLETLYESLQSNRKKIANAPAKLELPDQNILNQPLEELNNLDLEPPSRIAWKCIHILDAHDESVTDLAISHDNRYLFSTSWDKYLKLWSLEEGIELNNILASEQGIISLAISQQDYVDGGVITGGLDQDVKIWSLEENKEHTYDFVLKHHLQEHTGSVHGLAIASEKKIIVSGSFDKSLKQWDLDSGHLLYNSVNEDYAINAIAVHEEFEFVATGGGDGTVTLWELDGEKKVGELIGNVSSIESLVISPSGKLIAGGCADGSIKIWRLPTTNFSVFLQVEPSSQLKGHQGQVMNLLFTSDEQLIYSGGVDGLIRIWHPATSQELGHLKINEGDRIFSLVLSADDQILAAGGVNGNIKIWQQKNS